LIGTIRSDETRARFAQDWDNPRVIGKTHAVWAVVPVVVIVLLGAVAAFATNVAGAAYFGTSPAVVASLGVGAIATAAIGYATTRSNRAVGLAIVAGGWSVGLYLLLFGLAGLVHAESGPSLLAGTLARLVFAGHVPPLTLFVVAGLLTSRSLIGERHPGRPLIASVGLAAILFVASFMLASPGPPFAGVRPVFQVPYPILVGGLVVSNIWLATLLLPPVLLIWARRAARGERDRRRLATAAIASLVPVCQLLLCTLLGLAVDASGITHEGGVTLLIAGLGVAWPLTGVGFGLAVRGPGMRYTVSPGVLARAASLVLGVMTAMIAICAGLLISLGHGLGTTFVIAVAAVVVALALRPLAMRVLAALVGEPVAPIQSNGHSLSSPAVAHNGSRLSPLTHREREVLRLLAAGLSNAGIAAQLVLSERTIDAHLRSVFDKLDLPGSRHDNRRIQAAALWAHESGERHVPEPELMSKLG
jgi:DNA-binding CsgD family transcriptional regulator